MLTFLWLFFWVWYFANNNRQKESVKRKSNYAMRPANDSLSHSPLNWAVKFVQLFGGLTIQFIHCDRRYKCDIVRTCTFFRKLTSVLCEIGARFLSSSLLCDLSLSLSLSFSQKSVNDQRNKKNFLSSDNADEISPLRLATSTHNAKKILHF
jgi:hypothetical protein